MEERVKIERAIELVDSVLAPLDAEQVEVMLSTGRVLSERVSAWLDLPGTDIATLDGYAVKSEETAGAPIALSVAGKASFVNPFDGQIGPGHCLKVTTGSVIPDGTDAVVANEDVEDGEDAIRVNAEVKPGNGIRKRAQEFRMGEFVAEGGAVLNPGWIALLIAAGWSEVNVIRAPRVHVIAVGDELKLPGSILETGQVYASGGANIVAWCRKLGVSQVRLVPAVDDNFDVQENLPSPGVADMVITLGGTGKSERDVVIDALQEMDAEFLFRGIAAKPGHYTAFATLGNMPILCLPGGPGGADIMFQILGRRIICGLMGIMSNDLRKHPATLAAPVEAIPDIDRIARVKLGHASDLGLTAEPLSGKSMHRDLAETEGLVIVPAGQSAAEGDRVIVWVTT